VKASFEIGNHVKYAPPEEWILTGGSRIAKRHVKHFKLNQADPGAGKFVNIRDGSVCWPVGRAALDKIGPLALSPKPREAKTNGFHSCPSGLLNSCRFSGHCFV
jgi:hypothetical protein